ncbi:glycosyltransferase [Maribellus maritimus]|uniref:glycosyltransferase n=1 Tax=Maribellus maritimus TaxID=2870838 RepID=UPI001EEB40CC|nr:glycosyltransferase [Maribellus maritimus]MCG6190245.1 glycosyltransferase [Maribellus maritimus]
MLAPICLFTYKRLPETKQTVEALKRNDLASESNLIIFSDGPKNDADSSNVDAVRQYLHSVEGFKSVKVIESKENRGLARSIVSGVTSIVERYGKIIVLEDDIVTAQGFLKYMNDALEYYCDKNDVMQVSSFMFSIDSENLPDTFFYQANTCWGWGTWKRAWKYYSDDAEELLNKLKTKGIGWEHYNSYQGKEFQKQLIGNIKGSMKTWAVKWHSVMKLHDGKVLHPKTSYVQNIGFNGTGENCGVGDIEGLINNKLDLDVTDAEKYKENEAIERLKVYFKNRYSYRNKIKRKLAYYFK